MSSWEQNSHAADLTDGFDHSAPRPQTAAVQSYRALFELTTGFTYPESETGCPYSTTARRVWLSSQGSYEQYSGSEPVTVYFPGALRSPAGTYLKLPQGRSGQRFWCLWNAQAGRWEVCAPPQDTFHGRLKQQVAGGQLASVSLYTLDAAGAAVPNGIQIEGIFWAAPGQNLAADSYVTAHYDADAGAFFVTPS